MTRSFLPLLGAASSLLLFVPASPAASQAKVQSAKDIIPADSAMSQANPQWQRLLLSLFEADTRSGAMQAGMHDAGVAVAPADIGVKCGSVAVTLKGIADVPEAKGDFPVASDIPGTTKFLGVWVHRNADSNINSVGFQIRDAEGEYLSYGLKEQWDGWKWFEWDLTGGDVKQTFPQADKNGKIDFPIKVVDLVFYSAGTGPVSIAVDGLTAVSDVPASEIKQPFTSKFISGTLVEPGQPLAAQYLFTNYSDKPVQAQLDFSLQPDPSQSAPPAPDPVLGRDIAMGTKSWTEYMGKIVEEGSLTDGKVFTSYQLPFKPKSYNEAFQIIDLGKEQPVMALKTAGGDANWVNKVDVSYSLDGKRYTLVPELQGIDFHGQWGAIAYPNFKPIRARFLKFRYHNAGALTDAIAFPNGMAVYPGIGDEKWEIPAYTKPEVVDQSKVEVPAHGFAIASISSDGALPTGAYSLYTRLASGSTKLITQDRVFVFPGELKDPGDSQFGLNVSMPVYIPQVKRLGVTWLRFENLKWIFFNSEPGVFNFHGGVAPWHVNADDILKNYTEAGFNVLPFLFMTPQFASSAAPTVREDRRFFYPPKDYADYAEFARQVAARYGSKQVTDDLLKTDDKLSGLNRLKVIEFWNEPNLTDPGWGGWVGTLDQYYDMIRPASEAVKATDPSIKVLNAGYAGIEVKLVDGLRSHKYPDGKCPLDFIDILNVHYYSGRVPPEIQTVDLNADRSGNAQGNQTYEEGLHSLIAWRDKNKPGLPIWMSETGYDSAGPFGTTERLQAARLPRVVMMALHAGIDKVFVYREMGSQPVMHGASGLMREDSSYKPSYFTYATLIRQLDKAVPDRKLYYPDKNVQLYTWKRGNETILAAWTVDGTADLDLPLGRCLVTDAFGHQQEVDIQGKFPLTDYPVYITRMPNYAAAVAELDKKRDAVNADQNKENEKLAKLKAYLFDFGTKATEETLMLGTSRPFTPISKENVYAPGTPGFTQGVMSDDNAPWIKNVLNRTASRLEANAQFIFEAEPGKYLLRIAIGPIGERVHVSVSGPVEPIEQDIEAAKPDEVAGKDEKDRNMIEVPVELTSKCEVSVQVDGFASMGWLTMVEEAPK